MNVSKVLRYLRGIPRYVAGATRRHWHHALAIAMVAILATTITAGACATQVISVNPNATGCAPEGGTISQTGTVDWEVGGPGTWTLTVTVDGTVVHTQTETTTVWGYPPDASFSYSVGPGSHTMVATITGPQTATKSNSFNIATCPPPPPPEWDKSSVSVDGVCSDYSAVFTITNTGEAGEGDMDGPSQWRLYSGGVLVNSGTFQLAGGTSQTLTFAYSGSTMRLEADQRPGHPGSSQPQDDVTCEAPPPPTQPTCTNLTVVPGTGDVPHDVAATIGFNDPDGLVTGFHISWGDGSSDYFGTLPSASHSVVTAGSWTAVAYLQTGSGEITSPACQANYSGTLPPPPPGVAQIIIGNSCVGDDGLAHAPVSVLNAVFSMKGNDWDDGNHVIDMTVGNNDWSATADAGFLFDTDGDGVGDTPTLTGTKVIEVCPEPPPDPTPQPPISTGAGEPPIAGGRCFGMLIFAPLTVLGVISFVRRKR